MKWNFLWFWMKKYPEDQIHFRDNAIFRMSMLSTWSTIFLAFFDGIMNQNFYFLSQKSTMTIKNYFNLINFLFPVSIHCFCFELTIPFQNWINIDFFPKKTSLKYYSVISKFYSSAIEYFSGWNNWNINIVNEFAKWLVEKTNGNKY